MALARTHRERYGEKHAGGVEALSGKFKRYECQCACSAFTRRARFEHCRASLGAFYEHVVKDGASHLDDDVSETRFTPTHRLVSRAVRHLPSAAGPRMRENAAPESREHTDTVKFEPATK